MNEEELTEKLSTILKEAILEEIIAEHGGFDVMVDKMLSEQGPLTPELESSIREIIKKTGNPMDIPVLVQLLKLRLEEFE